MAYLQNISNDELVLLPPGVFGGETIMVDDARKLAHACEELARETVIGFDTETRPSFQRGKVNPVALLQLSSAQKAYLIRVNKLRLSPELVKIFENERIVKVGASIRDDLKILRKVTPFAPAGFVDLQSIVGQYGINELSVRKMSAIVLGIKVSKAQRLSNWEARQLTEAQQSYAATDAWVCREIFLKLTGYRSPSVEKQKRRLFFFRKK
ncbi:MAG: 3'-5' exonuclease domain-containing protein 2 [Rikenellaceae bacterium]|jgi:ribonuclease D|nr:3'-5' exonuclease domain-containing protein 2 [Rikenellaceae bacterium]